MASFPLFRKASSEMSGETTIQNSMQPAEFRTYHEPALQSDEVKHGLILNILARMGSKTPVEVSYWTLGGPGECAVRVGRHSIVLGQLDERQCRRLAELTAHTEYPGVIGPEMTARWFTDRARELGLQFLEPVSQQIYSISDKPRYPGVSGHARPVTTDDAALLADWLTAFYREAVPHDPVPTREELERAAGEERYMFWIDNGRPVSMAGIVRRLKNSAAIAGVYTPPELRGRGYAGSVTAAVVERIYAEGRKIACLSADLGNLASNRCYVKIGFTPLYSSLHFCRHA
jgi:predicted GNAT family acetyltransferase